MTDGIEGISLEAWKASEADSKIRSELLFGIMGSMNRKLDRLLSGCATKHIIVDSRIQAIEDKDKRRRNILIGMGVVGGGGGVFSIRELLYKWFG